MNKDILRKFPCGCFLKVLAPGYTAITFFTSKRCEKLGHELVQHCRNMEAQTRKEVPENAVRYKKSRNAYAGQR